MNILNDVIHNTVLSLFPLLVYLIYTSYKNITDKKHNNLILNICLFSSLYLCLKLGDITKNDKIILFCNIPIVVAYIKKRPLTGLILSLLTLCYCEAVLSQNTLILIFKYLSFYLAYIICSKKKEDDNQFIGIIAILQGFFISFEFFYKNKVEDFNLLLEIFLLVLVFYVISFLALYLFKIAISRGAPSGPAIQIFGQIKARIRFLIPQMRLHLFASKLIYSIASGPSSARSSTASAVNDWQVTKSPKPII